jgi:putative ABC transport system permease protein
MLSNYFKVAWRNLLRNKLYSAVNIAGLSIGLACCMLILLYVVHESSFDRFHPNGDRTYLVRARLKAGEDSITVPFLSYGSGPLAARSAAGVESFMRINAPLHDPVVENPADPSLKFTEHRFTFVDSNFFSFFRFRLTEGQANIALNNPFAVVLSAKAARKYFGDTDPVGKTIRIDHTYTYTVTGVAGPVPSNSSIDFDFAASLSSLQRINPEMIAAEGQIVRSSFMFRTFFMLKTGRSVPNLLATLQQLHKNADPAGPAAETYTALALTDLHLGESGKSSESGEGIAGLRYIRFFLLVALTVLVLALINYISLSTARSTLRAKEIGVRKAIGAGRKSIAVQFFAESALGTTLSFLFAYLLCTFLQPVFFNYLDWHIDNSFLRSPVMIGLFAALFLLTVLFSATYPAIVLSGFRPVQVLYGRSGKQAGGRKVRDIFTLFQFTVSTALVIVAMVIVRQIDYFRHADTGVQRTNVAMVPFSPAMGAHYPTLIKELGHLPAIEKVAIARYSMYKGYDTYFTQTSQGDKQVSLPVMIVDEHFPSFLGLKWAQAPKDSFYYNQPNTLLLNRSAVSLLNLGPSPVNESVNLGRYAYRVAGILEDFNYESLQNKIGPLGLMILPSTTDQPPATGWSAEGGCLFFRILPHTDMKELLDQVAAMYKRYDQDDPFEYYFMDDAYNALFTSEQRLSKISGLFSAFTILISCLGLLGLSVFILQQKNKEISIRKVLGAGTGNIVLMLSASFLRLIALAVLIAAPIAWIGMHKWLQSFAYRITISWWVFAVAALGTLVIAALTIGFQSFQAATQNPAKNLRAD